MPRDIYSGSDLAPGFNFYGFPRISPTAYSGSIIALLVVAVVVATYRTYLRVRLLRRLSFDDVFLLFAMACSIASAVFNVYNRNAIYNQVLDGLGSVRVWAIDTGFQYTFVTFLKTIHAVNILSWAAIFSVKFAYLMFFRPLTRGVRGLEMLWWIVLGFTVPIACVCLFITFYTCSELSEQWIVKCNHLALFERQGVVLKVTAALDIFTDVLIISIPILLISRVQINLTRKLTLIGILSLSSVMIVIEIVRVSSANLPHDQTDTVWAVYWCSIEASVAIIMVSMTTFRSIYGMHHTHRGSTPAESDGSVGLKKSKSSKGSKGSKGSVPSKTAVATTQASGGSATFITSALRTNQSARSSNDSQDSLPGPLVIQGQDDIDTYNDDMESGHVGVGIATPMPAASAHISHHTPHNPATRRSAAHDYWHRPRRFDGIDEEIPEHLRK